MRKMTKYFARAGADAARRPRLIFIDQIKDNDERQMFVVIINIRTSRYYQYAAFFPRGDARLKNKIKKKKYIYIYICMYICIYVYIYIYIYMCVCAQKDEAR
jgi:hypothetical protein